MRDTLRIRIVSIERQIQDFAWKGGFDHFIVPNELLGLVSCVDLVLDDDRPIPMTDQKVYVPILPLHNRIVGTVELGGLSDGRKELAQKSEISLDISMREQRVEESRVKIDLVMGPPEGREDIERLTPIGIEQFVERLSPRNQRLRAPCGLRGRCFSHYLRSARPQGESPAGRRVTIVRVSVSRTVTSLEGPLAV